MGPAAAMGLPASPPSPPAAWGLPPGPVSPMGWGWGTAPACPVAVLQLTPGFHFARWFILCVLSSKWVLPPHQPLSCACAGLAHPEFEQSSRAAVREPCRGGLGCGSAWVSSVPAVADGSLAQKGKQSWVRGRRNICLGMLSVPALLRRDKTCCLWAGGKASRAASREGANKGPAVRGAPGVGLRGPGQGPGRTPRLSRHCWWGWEPRRSGSTCVKRSGAAEPVGSPALLRLTHALDCTICPALLEPC